jgi:hypothetical protein
MGDELHRRREEEGRVPDANVTLLADKRATREASRRRSPTSRRAPAERQRRRPADRPRQLQRHAGRVQPAGPDLTVRRLARLLGSCPTPAVAFVNTTSSSGAFLPAIAAPGRVVVTATKTGGERNETHFPEPFVAAFSDAAADRDRNGHVSIAEAFEYAKAKVVQAFQQKGLLLTEHAPSTRAPARGESPSPRRSSSGPDAPRMRSRSTPAIRRCARWSTSARHRAADCRLKLKKPSMTEAQYDAQMEKLLTSLALKTQAIRELQAKKAKP